MNHSATLAERIASASANLTPTERRIADVILDDSTVVAFGTVAEVALLVGASGPSVVRFATKLGFEGYSALQADARRSLAERLKRPTDRIRRQQEGDVWSRSRSAATSGVEAVFESVPADTVRQMADRLAAAPRNIWIVGSEGSASALVLASGLRLLRPGVRHLTGSRSIIATELTDATEDDVVVAIDFSRYESAVVRTTELLVELGATLLAVTDGALSPIATLATIWCEIAVPAIGPFDSALPPVAVAELLLAEVSHTLAAQATARLDRAEALSASEQVFIDEHP